MNALDIEIALYKYIGFRQNLIVPNVHWGMHFKEGGFLHECDLLSLSKSNYATEYEIKVSKSDLLADKKKIHGHSHPAIKMLFFVVPFELKVFALENIPEKAGLLCARYYVDNLIISLERGAKIRKNHLKWTDKQRLKLAELGCMRLPALKNKLIRHH